MKTQTNSLFFSLCLCASVVSSSSAQDLTVKAPAQDLPVLIRHATAHPVSGPEIADSVIWLAEGKIKGVFSSADFAGIEKTMSWKSPGPVEIDATGKHVYPGMIAAYTQLGLDEIGMVDATHDYKELGDIVPEVRAIAAVNPDSTVLPVTRSNGVLAAGVFPKGGLIPGQPAVIQLEGWTWEDMAIEKSIGMTIEWPNVRPVSSWWMRTSEAEQKKRAKQSIDAIENAFSTATSYFEARRENASMPNDLRWDAMRGVLNIQPAKGTMGLTRQWPVFIVANDYDQIVSAVTWAATLKLRVVIVGGMDAPLCAELLKKNEVSVIVAGTQRFPKRDDSDYNQSFALPAKLKKAGIPFCIASGEETPHERNTPYAAGMATAHGLSQEDAIRSVTLSAAEILGVSGRLGSLDKDKDATLIITTGSPIEITTQITDAFISGKRIDLSNKQTKLYEKYRERYRQMGELKDRSGK
ncbi:MAG: amidohydrolase family protein [Phycisphaeraceae bacterium]|nr:amidohydrolase family protein [Phycisphaeraceae bacterium]